MTGWTVVVPVRGGTGKSRLEVPGIDRAALARAIGLDTVAAVRACGAVERVVVVTSDAVLAAVLPAGCELVGDPGTGLNPAVRAGLVRADPGAPRAAILGDLPALRPEELDRVLTAALEVGIGALPDADGLGTSLLTRTTAGMLDPAFGDGSFARHRAQGCVDLRETLSSQGLADIDTVRRDVDTLAHLRTAGTYGLGARTSHVLGGADPARVGAGGQRATSSAT